MEEGWLASIFVVEDDDTIALGLTSALEHADYRVVRFDRGEPALRAVAEDPPDLMLLDVMLPGIDGFEVLRQLREGNPEIPVILLTAKGTEADRVLGLETGADDYVTKPFSLRELLARVKARLRARIPDLRLPDVTRFGDVEVDLRRRILHRKGEEHRLTTHEAGVLAYLVANRGKDVTREELLEKVWGYSPSMNTRTVDNQILKLRKKIEDIPADPRHILTVHGIGYRFEM